MADEHLDKALTCGRCGCLLHPDRESVHARYHSAVDSLLDDHVMQELLAAERLERGDHG